MKVALLQLCSSDDPMHNLDQVSGLLDAAADQGAQMAFLPEVANCVSMSRAHQAETLTTESDDLFLAGIRAKAHARQLWVQACIAVKSDPPEPRFANRALMIAPDGEIVARYDKMHMFDVAVSETETYHESSGYAPGDRAVLADTPIGAFGLSICYDLRFAYLYRTLAQAGADVLCIPAAFSPGTGPGHWQPLLQARAIETGCWVIAAAQSGTHPAKRGKTRQTWGHSMVISPWGEIVLDAGVAPGAYMVTLDMAQVAQARRRLPALTHDRQFEGPK